VKGVYLHLMADALVSVGVVITGILISLTGIQWLDPIVSLAIMAVILYSTWGVLRESLKMSLDATPMDVDLESIKEIARKISGVRDIHHIHVWALSTTQNALTAHLVMEDNLTNEQVQDIKEQLKHELTHVNIHHATLETEQVICADSSHTSLKH
jgi:cobalt-zinc-cadmium efflux system protein